MGTWHKLLALMLGLLVLTLWGEKSALADTIYLKNGQVLIGIIDSVSSDDNVIVLKMATGTIKVPRPKVDRIEQQKDISYTEAMADLAASEGDLDRALELYQKALTNNADSQELKDKIKNIKVKIRERDQSIYGSSFNKIEQALKNHEFQAAIDEAQKLLERVGEPATKERCKKLISDAYIGIAREKVNVVDYPSAEKNYLLAKQAYEKNPMAALELADMLQWSQARKSLAIELYKEGIAQARENSELISPTKLLEYRFKLGRLYFDDEKFAEAADVFLEVVRNDKDIQYPRAVDYMVDAYARIRARSDEKEITKIIENLKSIIALKPHEEMTYVLLGRIYYDQGDWAKARDTFKAAIDNFPTGATNPAYQDALYYLAICYRKLKDIDGAAQVLQSLLQQKSGNYDAYCELGEIRLAQSAYTTAIDLFDQGLALDKDKYRAYMGKGIALHKLTRFQEARDNFQEVVNRDPTNAQAQLAIAHTYIDEEKYQEAVVASERAIAILRESSKDKATDKDKLLLAECYTLIGNASLAEKKISLSQENFKSALKEVEQYAPAFDGLGRAYQAEGRHNDAEENFTKAIKADPQNPDYDLRLAINWHNYRRNTKKALPYYLKYIELGGKDPQVNEWIVECGGTPPAGRAAAAALLAAYEAATSGSLETATATPESTTGTLRLTTGTLRLTTGSLARAEASPTTGTLPPPTLPTTGSLTTAPPVPPLPAAEAAPSFPPSSTAATPGAEAPPATATTDSATTPATTP